MAAKMEESLQAEMVEIEMSSNPSTYRKRERGREGGEGKTEWEREMNTFHV
jgi:hypothetical protein